MKDMQERIEKYFMDDGYHCRECVYKHCWEERHPWGMGTAAETLCECQVPRADECPAYDDLFCGED